MFPFKAHTETPSLDEAIETAFAHLASEEPTTDAYSVIVDQLKKLYDIKSSYEKDNKNFVSKDQLVAVAGSIAGILILVSYEHVHPITSKALGFVLKPKA